MAMLTTLMALAAAQTPAPCPTTPLTVSARGTPGLRRLNEEPPPRHIAAVDARRAGCPVVVALDRRDGDGNPLVEPAPAARPQQVVPR